MTGRKSDEKKISENVGGRVTLITADDLSLFNEGTHTRLYEKLGAHPVSNGDLSGTHFAVWAPNALRVSVTGDFNKWNRESHPLQGRGNSGIWEGFIPGISVGSIYQYHIESRYKSYVVDKADPMAFYAEIPPRTASIVADFSYDWGDRKWMDTRLSVNSLESPFSVYEVHLGSWRRATGDSHRFLSYREIAPLLAEHVRKLGFTHVEFLPVMEHPFFGSWGYQVTSYYAPSARFGSPADFMYLVDHLHRNGIGVILDWVPAHFPVDEYSLGFFDGTHLYEHPDPKRGFHPDWKSYIFNYGRPEIKSFLISNAHFWLDRYHADAIRVDGVASMLYLDYSRKKDEWVPNINGGRENIEAVDFLRTLNETIYNRFPDAQTIAEESTAWPGVTRPVHEGGLGFGMKWDMGWMHDTLQYFSRLPVYRKYHQNDLTFRILYAFTENFMLPLSHDEVVYGKSSLLGKMPGDDWQKFANLRLLFGYMYTQPGKKLLFMGAELAQWTEWNHDASLDWRLLEYERHAQIADWLREVNRLYRSEPALYENDFDGTGFEWIDASDTARSVLCYIRQGKTTGDVLLVACNFTSSLHERYRIGLPRAGIWKEVLNSDATRFGGSGQGNPKSLKAVKEPWHGRPFSLEVTLPPLSVVCFTSRRKKR